MTESVAAFRSPRPLGRRTGREHDPHITLGDVESPIAVGPAVGDHPELGDVPQAVGRRRARRRRASTTSWPWAHVSIRRAVRNERMLIEGPYHSMRASLPAARAAARSSPARPVAPRRQQLRRGIVRNSPSVTSSTAAVVGEDGRQVPAMLGEGGPDRSIASVGGAVEVGQVTDLVGDRPSRARCRRCPSIGRQRRRRRRRGPAARRPGRSRRRSPPSSPSIGRYQSSLALALPMLGTVRAVSEQTIGRPRRVIADLPAYRPGKGAKQAEIEHGITQCHQARLEREPRRCRSIRSWLRWPRRRRG